MNKNKLRKYTVVFLLSSILIILSVYSFTNSEFGLVDNKYDQKPKTGLGYVRTGRVEYKARDVFFLGDFTTNMATNDRAGKFVRFEVRLKMSDTDLVNELKYKNIILRDAVIEEMSLKRFSQVATEKGKMALKDGIKTRLNSVLDDGEINEVYLTKFIIQ